MLITGIVPLSGLSGQSCSQGSRLRKEAKKEKKWNQLKKKKRRGAVKGRNNIQSYKTRGFPLDVYLDTCSNAGSTHGSTQIFTDIYIYIYILSVVVRRGTNKLLLQFFSFFVQQKILSLSFLSFFSRLSISFFCGTEIFFTCFVVSVLSAVYSYSFIFDLSFSTLATLCALSSALAYCGQLPMRRRIIDVYTTKPA